EMSGLKRLIYFYDANDISVLKLIRYSYYKANFRTRVIVAKVNNSRNLLLAFDFCIDRSLSLRIHFLLCCVDKEERNMALIISASGSAGLSPKSLCRSKSPCICAKACSPILTEVSNCDESSTVSSPVKVRLKVLHPCRQYHSVTANKRYPALPNFEENRVAEEFHIFQDRMALIQI
ncbi:hypothetical protein ALC60_09593, partial [Trachymyrmex zeteki]